MHLLFAELVVSQLLSASVSSPACKRRGCVIGPRSCFPQPQLEIDGCAVCLGVPHSAQDTAKLAQR